MQVWKLKDIHYNHQTLCILGKKRVKFTTITFMLTGNCSLLWLRGTVLMILLPTQLHFSKVISYHMTVQVMWTVPAWGLTFQLPQKTLIIRIASQDVFTKCTSFQTCLLIVTVELTPFWGYLQLGHPVTYENIKCCSHFQIPTQMKSYSYFNNLLTLTL